MKEIKIIQGDDGAITIESMGAEGEPSSTPVESIEEALEQIKSEFGGAEEAPTEPIEEPEGEPMPEMPEEGEEVPEGPIAASKGKKLEDKMPMDKKKMGMRPKMKADWSDYGAM